jgi:hypothetical protein
MLYFDTSLNFIKGIPIYGKGNDNDLEFLNSDAKGNVYAFGKMRDDMYIGNDTLHMLGGETDFFMAKYGQANCYCPELKSMAKITDSSQKRTLTLLFTGYGADSVVFDWGDGNQSKGNNPTHMYAKDTVYTITVKAYNSCYVVDTYSLTHQFAKASSQVVLGNGQTIRYFPNPVDDALYMEWEGMGKESMTLQIYNTVGEKVYEEIIPAGMEQYKLSTKALQEGMYVIQVKQDHTEINVGRLLKR